jgi:hypothetical protein
MELILIAPAPSRDILMMEAMLSAFFVTMSVSAVRRSAQIAQLAPVLPLDK